MTDAHRADRLRRAGWSVLAGYALRAAAVAASLASVPLLLRYLGPERYGVWLALVSVTAMLSVFDLGLGSGLRNRIAEARGQDAAGLAGELFSTAAAAGLLWGAAIALVGAVLAVVLPVAGWLGVQSGQAQAELPQALVVILILNVIGLPVALGRAAQSGFQESYVGDLWAAGGTLLTVLAFWLATVFGWGLATLAAATFLFTLPIHLLGLRHFFRRHPYTKASLGKVRFRQLPALLSLGWQFFLIQAANTSIWQTDSLIVAAVLGAAAVAPYGIAFRLMGLPLSLLQSIPNALVPAFTEARMRGDWDWIRGTYRRVTVLTSLAAGLVAVCLYVWGQDFIEAWAGPDAKGGALLMAGLCSYLILGQWSMCNATLVSAMSRPRVQVLATVAAAAANIGLSIYLLGHWGIAGAAWGTALSAALVSAWLLALGVWLTTDRRIAPPWRETLAILSLPVALSLGVGLGVQALLPAQWPGLGRVALGVTMMASAYCLVAWAVTPKQWKASLRSVFAIVGAQGMTR